MLEGDKVEKHEGESNASRISIIPIERKRVRRQMTVCIQG